MTSDPKQIKLYLSGERRLPAGAIPLAVGDSGGLVCLMPGDRWALWLGGVASSLLSDIQPGVLKAVIKTLGLTSEDLAARLGYSPRTVEAWRTGVRPITVDVGYRLAEMLAEAN